MKRDSVLIICYDFLPYFPSFGGVSRMVHLYKNLKTKGFDVRVVSSRGAFFGYFGHECEIDRKDIAYVESFLNVRKQAIKKTIARSERSNVLRRWITAGIRTIAAECIVPDYSVLDLFRFYKVVTSLLKDRPAETIVVSVPKHGVSLIVPLLRRLYGYDGLVILDYRDSWNTQPIFRKRTKVANWISKRLEAATCKSVDVFTYVSPVVPTLMKEQLGIDWGGRHRLIYNGFDASIGVHQRDAVPLDGTIRLLYFGAGSDDPRSYRCISLLFEFAKRHSQLQIDFLGDIEVTQTDLSSYSNVTVGGSVPTRQLGDLSRTYHWSIVLHTDEVSGREVIPGKFFDCLNFKIPVLCVAPSDSEVAKLTDSLGVGCVVAPSIEALDLAFESLRSQQILDRLAGVYARHDFSIFERRAQADQFIEVIRQNGPNDNGCGA